VGVFKRHDLTDKVYKAMDHEDKSIRFWALWSAILLGDKNQAIHLVEYFKQKTAFQREAMQLAFRSAPVTTARKWVNELSQEPQHMRDIIIITGIMGDPQSGDWLIQRMQDQELCRVAAESFCMITGIDLEAMEMTTPAPENYEPLPNDDAEDERVMMHDDENLPWPDTLKLAAYWNSVRSRFDPGHRYLLGNPIKPELLSAKLPHAYQRQRHAIAYELALLDKHHPLINTRRIVSRR
jgi:uncharacterized protein (TIGR02270 family)